MIPTEMQDQVSESFPKIVLPIIKTYQGLYVLISKDSNGKISYLQKVPEGHNFLSLDSYESFIYTIADFLSFKVYYRLFNLTNNLYYSDEFLRGSYRPLHFLELKDVASLYEEELQEELKGAILGAIGKLL